MYASRTTAKAVTLSLIAALLLSACGGNDSGGRATLSGQVVGSYIENARVCMDANKNGLCDVDEPAVRSGRDGSFTIEIVSGADLLADIGTDAYTSDRADFSDRKAVRARYTLRSANALWSTGSTVISPLSSVVSAGLDNGLTEAVARSKLAGVLAVDPAELLVNYNSETD